MNGFKSEVGASAVYGWLSSEHLSALVLLEVRMIAPHRLSRTKLTSNRIHRCHMLDPKRASKLCTRDPSSYRASRKNGAEDGGG